MPTMLRNRKTGELMGMNPDMARHDDMIPIDVPDLSVAETRRGLLYLSEKHVFENVESAPEPPKKRTRIKRASTVEEPAVVEENTSPESDDAV